MKIHPLILFVLVLCALGGAFAIGRLGQVSSTALATASVPVQADQVVATGRQHAEIETPEGTFTIEAGMETQ